MTKIIEDIALDFNDVLIQPRPSTLTSRKDVDLNVKYETLHSKKPISGIPIISANMSTISTFSMAKALANENLYCALHKHYSVSELLQFYNTSNARSNSFYTLGIHDFDKLKDFSDHLGYIPNMICCDVANGYMKTFLNFVKKVRYFAPNSIIMAGNVVTPNGCINLIDSGTDIVKLGIGSSSVCRTRTVTGIGMPQFSAILNCAETVRNYNALLCSDGGCNVAADFAKAFGAGAHFVMAGTIFAGHDECEGDIIDGKMQFFGMSSEAAMQKHNNGMANYRSSEGILTFVEYKGPVIDTVNHILGGLRSACTYTNSKNLSEFYHNVEFVKVNRTYNNRWDI
jgi:GMP reductase